MIFAFAPIAALLLGVSDIAIPWETLLLSVILYVVIPLLAGIATRYLLYKFSSINNLNRILVTVKPFSMLGLILTVLLLFTLQAEVIIDKPQIILLDEATAGLDFENKTALLDVIERLSKSYIVVIISHEKLSLSNQKLYSL